MARALELSTGEGMTSYGGWCSMPGTISAEIMARSGLDWICIDCQHGLIDYRDMVTMLYVAESINIPALVRVAWNQPADIMRALDAGASAVIVPMVNNLDDAAAAISAARYAPSGVRSWGPIRATLADAGWTADQANRTQRCILQIESTAAIRNLRAILDCDGVEAVYVGPADLALDHGMSPSIDVVDPAHHALVEDVLTECEERSIPAGIHCLSPEAARKWGDLGFSFAASTSDVALLRTGVKSVHAHLRNGSAAVRDGAVGVQ